MVLDAQRDLLEEWNERIRAAQQNLFDLHEDVTYKRLVDTSRRPRSMISGVTRETLEPVLEALNELWEHVGLVRDVVDEAQAAYDGWAAHTGQGGLKRLVTKGPDEKQVAATVDRLLQTASITLPPVSTPLAKRKLGTAGTLAKKISPDALFRIMEDAFSMVAGPVVVERAGVQVTLDTTQEPQSGDVVVGGIITRVAQIWRAGDARTESLVDEIAAVKVRAKAMSVSVDDLEAAEKLLDGYKSFIRTDPLGAQALADNQVRSALRGVLDRVEQMERDQRNLQNQLDAAVALHARLLRVWADACAVYRERLTKIASPQPDPYPAPAAQSVIQAFQPWLEKLTPMARAGRPAAVVGLTRFVQEADLQVARAESCLAQNQQPLSQRNELKDTFNCLQVRVSTDRMQAFPSVMDASREAAAALQHPTDLARARRAIDRFRQAIQ